MDTAHHEPSAQQAREQLAAASTRSLGSPRDRRVRAAGTAAIGVLVAACGTASVVLSAQASPVTGPMVAAGSVLAATPALVAAAVIARRRG